MEVLKRYAKKGLDKPQKIIKKATMLF